MEPALARYVAPDCVAPTDAPFEPFLLHALLFRSDEVEKGIAGDVDEAMRCEQLSISSRGQPPTNRSRSPIATYSGLLRALSSGSGKALLGC